MGKTLCILSGLFLFAVIIATVVAMIPDHVEGTVFSFLAHAAEDAKREAILNSPEVMALEFEVEALQAQIEAVSLACPAEPQGWKARIAGFLPWGN